MSRGEPYYILANKWPDKPCNLRLVNRYLSDIVGNNYEFQRPSGRKGIVGLRGSYHHGYTAIWWDNGHINHLVKMICNKKDGEELFWNEDGILVKRRLWKMGVPMFRHYFWHKNGNPRSIISYTYGKYNVEAGYAQNNGKLSWVAVRSADGEEVDGYDFCHLNHDIENNKENNIEIYPHLLNEKHYRDDRNHGPQRTYMCSQRVSLDLWVVGRKVDIPSQAPKEFEKAHITVEQAWENMNMIPEEDDLQPLVEYRPNMNYTRGGSLLEKSQQETLDE
jgi:antitoxin component YwqK of YwqJK toxin-antitoxin module